LEKIWNNAVKRYKGRFLVHLGEYPLMFHEKGLYLLCGTVIANNGAATFDIASLIEGRVYTSVVCWVQGATVWTEGRQ